MYATVCVCVYVCLPVSLQLVRVFVAFIIFFAFLCVPCFSNGYDDDDGNDNGDDDGSQAPSFCTAPTTALSPPLFLSCSPFPHIPLSTALCRVLVDSATYFAALALPSPISLSCPYPLDRCPCPASVLSCQFPSPSSSSSSLPSKARQPQRVCFPFHLHLHPLQPLPCALPTSLSTLALCLRCPPFCTSTSAKWLSGRAG